jgi:hypothetical protein
MSKETIGKVATDLLQKPIETRDPIELERSMHKDYEKEVYETVMRARKEISTDFYVVVITKRERLLENVFRNYFFYRHSCPTPDYDQAVYRYHAKEQELEFLWVIPSRDTCYYLLENESLVRPDEYHLLSFVKSFQDQTLFKICKTLNGEL